MDWVRLLSRLAVLLLLGQLVFSIVTYPLLPSSVPSHWNAAGQVNSYLPSLGFILIFVGISVGLFVLLRGIGLVVRMADQTGYGNAIISVVTLFPLVTNLIVQVIVTAVVLHW